MRAFSATSETSMQGKALLTCFVVAGAQNIDDGLCLLHGFHVPDCDHSHAVASRCTGVG